MPSEKGYKNLIPWNTLSPEEQHEFKSKGGKRSAEVKKEKANFKQALTDVLEGKPSEPLVKVLKKAGIKDADKLSYLVALVSFGALKTHSSKTSLNEITRFLEFARDSIGQKPAQEIKNIAPEGKLEAQNIIQEIINAKTDDKK